MLLVNTSCVAFVRNLLLHCTVPFLHGAGHLLESRRINWSRSTPHPYSQNLYFFFKIYSSYLMKFSRADSRVRMWFSDVSGTDSVPIFRAVLKLRMSQFPKRRKTFTSSRGCLPEKISFNSVAAKRLILLLMCFSRAFSSLNWLVSSGFMRMKNALEGIWGPGFKPGASRIRSMCAD